MKQPLCEGRTVQCWVNDGSRIVTMLVSRQQSSTVSPVMRSSGQSSPVSVTLQKFARFQSSSDSNADQ